MPGRTTTSLHAGRGACIVIALVTLSPGCGSPAETAKGLEAYAEVAVGQGELDEATKAARAADEAARKQAYDEQEAARAAEQAAWDAEMQRVLVLPEKLPKSATAGCNEIPKAYEAYMVRIFDEDADAGPLMMYYDNKSKILGEIKGKCLKVNSTEAVACQLHALANASKVTKNKDKELLAACVERFAPEVFARLAESERALKAD